MLDFNFSKIEEADAKHEKSFEAGQLIITVLKASHIHHKTFYREPDPYVQITVGEQKAISSTVRGNSNPEWNFQTTFQVDQNTPKTIKVEVFDENGNRSIPIPLGYRTTITRLLLNKILWFQLDDSRSGEICLAARYIPTANVQNVKMCKTEEGKEQDLEASERPESVTTPKQDAC